MSNFITSVLTDSDIQKGLLRGVVLIASYMLLRPQLEQFLAERAEKEERRKLLQRKEEGEKKKKAAAAVAAK
ncbi:hypothetical protein DV735_g1360, partial [Chaetothyriales sp. CBS 134920]